ncbi:unnamed protein product, partial [Mesorhabditis belari]|uniref:Ribosome biogenesis protein NOP53 n=1 Tax=Mesorhabditis belari TaxID=2138241 RepID=A0AAF3J5B3_9BILA
MVGEKGGVKRKRPAASRVSRSKKRYWRKGADVGEIEEAAVQIQHEKDSGGQIAERADDDLFSIDRAPTAKEEKKFTKKQQAALKKISALATRNANEVSLPMFPKKPSKPLKKLPRPTVEVKKAMKTSVKKNFDLWETDLESKLVQSVPDAAKDGAAYYLQQTKKVQSKVPKTLRLKSSLLKAVEVPEAGASYNPELESYVSYVQEIAKDEMKTIAEEARSERRSKLASGESMVTSKDKWKEVMAGLEDDESNEVKMEAEDVNGESFLSGPVQVNPKTRRQRRKQKEQKEREQKRLSKKANESNVFRSKKILKKIAEEEAAHKDKLKMIGDKKALDDMTKRKKLGKGRFEEEETPFLLTEEITGSLRQLKPQGNLLADRMKSLQKRNILPIAGDRNQHRLKQKLRFKVKENRSHKEVKQGTVLR